MKSLAASSPLMKLSIPVRRCLILALSGVLVAAVVYTSLVKAQDMPTAEEMQEMMEGMRQMQEEMENLDPETRKQLEQMMTNPPVSSGTDDGAQPVRNDEKLAEVSPSALTANELKSYIETLLVKIAAAITAEARGRAESINTELGKAGDYLPRLRAAANGLAVWGALPEATYLMGKLALASGSVQDLSNLAAFLSMQHAETAALPILYTLNARNPNNSTLLNNLGQARYGLGETAEAEKLFIAAIQITPLHPQANLTLARIQMARGDNQAAQASLHKALQGGFSDAKEEELRKAGGKLNADDVRWRRPMPQDPLGLEKFVVPAWPMKAAELPVATREWKAFRQMLSNLGDGLGQQQSSVSSSLNSQGAIMKAALATARAPFLKKATALQGNITEQYEIAYKKQMTALAEAVHAGSLAYLELEKRIEAIDEAGEEKYKDVPGGYAREYTCGEVAAEIDTYLSTHNQVYAQLQPDILATQRRYMNELAYLSQYTSATPELFELTKLSIKGNYLAALDNLVVALFPPMDSRAVCFEQPPPPKGGGKLANFDDFHCEYISTMNMPGVGSIVSRCNVTEARFDPVFAPFKASWTAEIDDNNNNHLTRASAQVSIEGVTAGGHSEFDADGMKSGGLSVGVTTDLGPKLKGGPLEIGVEVGVTMGMEFDRSGITDVSVNAGVESSSTSTIGDTGVAKSEAGVTAGANSTWSWNSGFSGDVGAGFDSSVF